MKNTDVTIDMAAFDLASLIDTTAEKIDWCKKQFATKADSYFCQGKGKVALLIRTYNFILLEDMHFNEYSINDLKRYEFFKMQCVVFASLYSYLNKSKVPTYIEETT